MVILGIPIRVFKWSSLTMVPDTLILTNITTREANSTKNIPSLVLFPEIRLLIWPYLFLYFIHRWDCTFIHVLRWVFNQLQNYLAMEVEYLLDSTVFNRGGEVGEISLLWWFIGCLWLPAFLFVYLPACASTCLTIYSQTLTSLVFTAALFTTAKQNFILLKQPKYPTLEEGLLYICVTKRMLCSH